MVKHLKLHGDADQRRAARHLERHIARQRAARRRMPRHRSPFAGPAHREHHLVRAVYAHDRRSRLPGRLVRGEGHQPVADPAVNRVYDFIGATFDLYFRVFKREWLEGRLVALRATVHFAPSRAHGLDNAFWNGRQLLLGDGCHVFRDTTTDIAIVAHELSHGVVHCFGGLDYRGQSGSLNEHLADVFGTLTKQYLLKHSVGEADWLIGAGAVRDEVNGPGVRSLKAPGTAYAGGILGSDPQPFHMSGLVRMTEDHGGVHINSGIPNHAFYLLAMMLGGRAWERAGHIWYDSLHRIRSRQLTFGEWADITVQVASERHGAGSRAAKLTRLAWKLVGIDV